MGNNLVGLSGDDKQVILFANEHMLVLLSTLRHGDQSSSEVRDVQDVRKHRRDRTIRSVHLELNRPNSNSSHSGSITNVNDDWFAERRVGDEPVMVRTHVMRAARVKKDCLDGSLDKHGSCFNHEKDMESTTLGPLELRRKARDTSKVRSESFII